MKAKIRKNRMKDIDVILFGLENCIGFQRDINALIRKASCFETKNRSIADRSTVKIK